MPARERPPVTTADRPPGDPTAWTWPAWAHVLHRSYGWELVIARRRLRAAALNGAISCSSLPVLHRLALHVDEFDLQVAAEQAKPSATTRTETSDAR